jgi:hypothetical protein
MEVDHLHLIRSHQLAQYLARYDLIGRIRLMIDPLFVGEDKRLFGDHAPLRRFRLERGVPTVRAPSLPPSNVCRVAEWESRRGSLSALG